MLGPSSSGLINFGGRFAPCMKTVTEVPLTLQLGCRLILSLTLLNIDRIFRHEQYRKPRNRVVQYRDVVWVWWFQRQGSQPVVQVCPLQPHAPSA